MPPIAAAATAVAFVVLASAQGPIGTADTVEPRRISQGTQVTDAVKLAAHGGFLLGNARRCGIPHERVSRASQLVQALIMASASDERDSEDAGNRFSDFFTATAFPSEKDKRLPISCKTVLSEFQQLEAHNPLVGEAAQTAMNGAAMGETGSQNYGPQDGE